MGGPAEVTAVAELSPAACDVVVGPVLFDGGAMLDEGADGVAEADIRVSLEAVEDVENADAEDADVEDADIEDADVESEEDGGAGPLTAPSSLNAP